MQAVPSLSKGNSADGSEHAVAGSRSQSYAESGQAADAAAAVAATAALPHTGSGESLTTDSGGVLPMEVDDDAMFQRKQPKTSKADAQVR